MLLIMFFLSISGAAIAYGIVYAAFELLKLDRMLKNAQQQNLKQKLQTLTEISQLCKQFDDADDNTTTKLLRELEGIRRWIEKYY